MKQNELRLKMPEVAGFIDSLCDAFGKESIHGQIRKGLLGEPVFFAAENGYEIGARIERGTAITWHPVTLCSIESKVFFKSKSIT